MKTLYRKDNSCNTPFKDLMDKALKNYDEASRLAHHFNSDIPKAIIKFYTDKIEAQPEQPVYDKQYLNDCIEKATPGLSKITDVDKALDEIRGNEPKQTAEDWLKENCDLKDWNRLEENLNDSLWTNNVLKYMKEYAQNQQPKEIREELIKFVINKFNQEYPNENITWSELGRRNFTIMAVSIPDWIDEYLNSKAK